MLYKIRNIPRNALVDEEIFRGSAGTSNVHDQETISPIAQAIPDQFSQLVSMFTLFNIISLIIKSQKKIK